MEVNLIQQKKESGLPVDNILHSLWSSVDVKLNHTLVSSSGTNYMYKALIENLLNYSGDTKKNTVKCCWVFW